MRFFFDGRQGPIRVVCELVGPIRTTVLRMVLDTGATRTLISSSHLLATGYDPSTAAIRMETTTASGVEYAPCVTIQRLRTLGQERSDFPVLALTLPPSSGVDGLLGLDFFRDCVLSIDFRSGLIALA